MKAEDKAAELVEKYFSKLEDVGTISSEVYKDAKQCALICVGEILESYPTYVKSFHTSKGLYVVHEDNRTYWNKVKEEIKQM